MAIATKLSPPMGGAKGRRVSTARRATAELAARELARRRLVEFTTYTYPRYQPAAVHQLLAEYLEQVERYVASGGAEGIGRLMVFMPPRSGKSELVSVRFPAWFLGRNPDNRVILASCTAGLAENFSRQVRDLIQDTSYRAVFGDLSRQAGDPIMVSESSRSVSAWQLAGRRGGMVATGVGGSIIGRGAHVLVIDDPLRSRSDAESKTVRARVDDWYRSTARTRLAPGGAVVLMHQRWHEDDLAGRLIRKMVEDPGADQWVILSLAAIAEDWAVSVNPDEMIQAAHQGWWKGVDPLGRQPGAALWTERFDLDWLRATRASLGGYEWDALYQQRPRPLEGALIKAYAIEIIPASQVPDNLQQVRYWDLAVSARAGYIVGARMGRGSDGRIYILDVARLRGPWADARSRMIEVMRNDDVAVIQGIEISGQQGGYFQELQRDLALGARALRAVNPARVGNKEVRAQVWASRIPDGLVYMVRGPWNDDFLAEAVAFPQGAHDDQVDAVSGAVQMLGGGGWMLDLVLRHQSEKEGQNATGR